MYSTLLDRISYHVVYDESVLSALEYAHANGFSGIQIGVESPHLSFERLTDDDIHAIARYAENHGIRIVIHGPDSLSLYQTSQYLIEGTFAYYEALFSFAEAVGCRLITLHLGSFDIFRTDTTTVMVIPEADRLAYASAARHNLDRLVQLANGRFTICIENYKLDETSLGLLRPYLDSGQLSLCWDLAKTFDKDLKINVQLEEYFWQNLRHIRQVHLHDMKAGGRSHLIIGSADMDFMRFLPRLAEADVLDYCIEVRPKEKALESLNNLLTLLRCEES